MGELFEVRVESTFDAAPRHGAGGDPEPPRPRRWRVAVTARSRRLDRIAIVVDFRKLRARIDGALAELAEREPSEVDALGSTSAEGIARWLLRRMQELCDGEDWWVDAVEVQCDPSMAVRLRAEEA